MLLCLCMSRPARKGWALAISSHRLFDKPGRVCPDAPDKATYRVMVLSVVHRLVCLSVGCLGMFPVSRDGWHACHHRWAGTPSIGHEKSLHDRHALPSGSASLSQGSFMCPCTQSPSGCRSVDRASDPSSRFSFRGGVAQFSPSCCPRPAPPVS